MVKAGIADRKVELSSGFLRRTPVLLTESIQAFH